MTQETIEQAKDEIRIYMRMLASEDAGDALIEEMLNQIDRSRDGLIHASRKLSALSLLAGKHNDQSGVAMFCQTIGYLSSAIAALDKGQNFMRDALMGGDRTNTIRMAMDDGDDGQQPDNGSTKEAPHGN